MVPCFQDICYVMSGVLECCCDVGTDHLYADGRQKYKSLTWPPQQRGLLSSPWRHLWQSQ